MKKCDEVREILIDEFYDEKLKDDIREHIKNCPECLEFMKKLHSVSEKLDILNLDEIPVPSNMFDIIDDAQNIKDTRKKRFEIPLFVLSSLCILLPFAGLGLYIGMKFLIYLELILYINLPLILIPLIKNKLMKGAER
jgi:predicted anti-sigma-YlaC factor YlaD